MSKHLDCRGLQCPAPVIRCRELIKNDNPSSISILVDNMAAVENVRRFLSNQGFHVDAHQINNSEWRLNATKTDENIQHENVPQNTPKALIKTLILITTDTLGRGDDQLGTKLMETFLETLQEITPWRIILLNSGVKISASPGPALESLKKLANNGTEILVCGTCLGFYNLLDKKAVGETTNMLDVVTSLGVADKVIRP